MSLAAGIRRWLGVGPGRVLLLLGLAAVLYLPGLGVETLRHPLEAKYALAAREMLRGGPLLVARLFGEPYPDKPPLYFWAVAGLGRLAGGVGEVTARLPAVAGAVVGLLAVLRLGADLFGPRAGLLAALALATSNLFFWYARQGHPDQFLTALVALACLLWWRGLTRPGPAGRLPAALAYAAMALGVMSKGLLGLLLPVLGAALFLALTGPPRAILPGLRLGLGLPVFLAVLLAWYAPAVAREGLGYLHETIVHQHVVRYARTWVHKGPWYYYFGEFGSGFFPWVLFLPGALWLGWRSRLAAFRFPLAWFVAGFVFLSLSTSKRGAYLLPLYPAAALMVGWLLDRGLPRSAAPTGEGPAAAAGASAGPPPAPARSLDARWVDAPLALLAGAAALLAVAVVAVPRRLIPGNMVDTLIPSSPVALASAVALLLAGAALVGVPWWRGRPGLAVGALVAVQSLLLLGVTTVRAPQYEARFPARAFAARVRVAVPPDRPLWSLLDDYNYVVAFYVDRPLVPLPDPSALLAVPADGSRYALVDHRDDAILGRPDVTVIEETRLGPKRIALVRF